MVWGSWCALVVGSCGLWFVTQLSGGLLIVLFYYVVYR